MLNQDLTLYEQLRRECDAMARHALGSGLNIPPRLAERLDRFETDDAESARADLPNQSPADNDPTADTRSRKTGLTDIIRIHQALASVVAPATPRTIRLLADEACRSQFLYLLGPVPLIRQLMVVAIISLLSLILIILSPDINEHNMRAGLTKLSGWTLLTVEMLYVSAAAVGASFAALHTANRYVADGTFDPKFGASYWVRIILGIISGVLMADFVPVDAASVTHIHKPLLAILGGFSASLVYRILSRLVETVESLFRGDPRAQISQIEVGTKAMANAQASQQNAALAKRLMTLQQSVIQQDDPKQISQHIDEMVSDLIPDDFSRDPAIKSEPTVESVGRRRSARRSKKP